VTSVPFWEDPETVAFFAGREPDHRLTRLLGLFPAPSRARALDLGCAAGRNTRLLAARGFDVFAVDASRAMAAAARERTAPVLGDREAAFRIRVGTMDRLDDFDGGSFDLIVALGVYHGARTREEWERALDESARVAARGAWLLVANHTKGFAPEGVTLVPSAEDPDLVDGHPSGRSFLVDAPELDIHMRRHGFVPLVPTETVVRPEGGGRRATANGLYIRR
jgi:SAM-dependent methyltransferase